jgi:hypothetical protein
MLKNIAAFLFLLLILGISYAGTVKLNGACNSLLVNNSIIFSLSNKGNDTAYNLFISPVIHGATPINSSFSFNALAPGDTITLNAKLTNFGLNGTYAEEFIVSYQQGFSSFTAIFPCLVSIGKPTISPIYETVTTTPQEKFTIVNVSLFNAGSGDITGNLYLMVPPTFTFLSSKNYTFNLSPYSTQNFTFEVASKPGMSTYSVAAVASFEQDKLHYTSMAIFSIGSYSSPKGISLSGLSTVEIAIILVALIIVILLAIVLRSILRKNKPKS